ncbi:MAG: ArsR family transcriptional regulator, partial [Euryarchaeota archaeon]|nr:ArsR family transcriptional regulator [Euryarchaeota archaeon]
VFDEADEEFVDILIKMGLTRRTAKVLAYLKCVDKVRSNDIEVGADLRQPDVSSAMQELRENRWIDESDEKKHENGRSHKVYSLKVPINKIIGSLEEEKKKEAQELLKNIERLKALSA